MSKLSLVMALCAVLGAAPLFAEDAPAADKAAPAGMAEMQQKQGARIQAHRDRIDAARKAKLDAALAAATTDEAKKQLQADYDKQTAALAEARANTDKARAAFQAAQKAEHDVCAMGKGCAGAGKACNGKKAGRKGEGRRARKGAAAQDAQ